MRFSLSLLCVLSLGLAAGSPAAEFFEVPERSTFALGDGLRLQDMEASKGCVTGSTVVTSSLKTEYFVDSALQTASLLPTLFQRGRFNLANWQYGLLDRIYQNEYQARRRTLYYLVKASQSAIQLDKPRIDTARVNASLCGDAFIDRVVTGGYVLLSLHLDFNSENDASKVMELADLGTLSMTRLGKFLDTVAVNLNDGLQLSFEMDQVGGDPNQLSSIFGAGKTAISCRYPNVQDCIKLLESARVYMVNPDRFVAQLNNQGAIRQFSLRAYRDEELSVTDLFRIRDQLTVQERSGQAALRAAETPTPQLTEQLKTVTDLRASCFANRRACQASSFPIPERRSIIAPDTFLNFCKSRYKTAALNIFTDEMQRRYRTESCGDLFLRLAEQNSLSLRGLGLDQISFLSGLTRLEVLDLAQNQLTNLDSLPVLPRLYSLDLQQNRLATLRGLGNAPALQKLRLDNNQLTDIILPPLHLFGLRALQNPLASIKATYDRLQDIQALYLQPADICAVYRDWAATHQLVGVDDATVYASLNFAPVVNDKYKKNSVKDWVNCEVVYQNYGEVYPELEL